MTPSTIVDTPAAMAAFCLSYRAVAEEHAARLLGDELTARASAAWQATADPTRTGSHPR